MNAEAGTQDIIDYAMPMMRIEKLMRELHDLCLKSQYKDAVNEVPKLITEARILQASLAIMSEKAR